MTWCPLRIIQPELKRWRGIEASILNKKLPLLCVFTSQHLAPKEHHQWRAATRGSRITTRGNLDRMNSGSVAFLHHVSKLGVGGLGCNATFSFQFQLWSHYENERWRWIFAEIVGWCLCSCCDCCKDIHVIFKISDQGGGMPKRVQREAREMGELCFRNGLNSLAPNNIGVPNNKRINKECHYAETSQTMHSPTFTKRCQTYMQHILFVNQGIILYVHLHSFTICSMRVIAEYILAWLLSNPFNQPYSFQFLCGMGPGQK